MQFQYSGCFDCFSLAFLSICQKNRQRFANESLILKLLKFSFEGQLYIASTSEGCRELGTQFH